MNFSSLEEFIAMGGHGLYVWLSYGAGLIIVVYNVVAARMKFKRALQAVRDRERRRAASSTTDASSREE
ncbi:MAG: heme exporter protein CcmD [Gammaproteobacteria bacterium]|nr:heme exporter protein CcmD [Gammaproteobacteria bacterium]